MIKRTATRSPFNSLQLANHEDEVNSNIVELKEISIMINERFESWRENFKRECVLEGEIRGEQLETWTDRILNAPTLATVLETH